MTQIQSVRSDNSTVCPQFPQAVLHTRRNCHASHSASESRTQVHTRRDWASRAGHRSLLNPGGALVTLFAHPLPPRTRRDQQRAGDAERHPLRQEPSEVDQFNHDHDADEQQPWREQSTPALPRADDGTHDADSQQGNHAHLVGGAGVVVIPPTPRSVVQERQRRRSDSDNEDRCDRLPGGCARGTPQPRPRGRGDGCWQCQRDSVELGLPRPI